MSGKECGAATEWAYPRDATEFAQLAGAEHPLVNSFGVKKGTPLDVDWASFADLPAGVSAKYAPAFAGGLLGGAGAHRLWVRPDRELHAALHYMHRNCGSDAIWEDALRPAAEDGAEVHGVNCVVFGSGPVWPETGLSLYFDLKEADPEGAKAVLGEFPGLLRKAFGTAPAGGRACRMAGWWQVASAFRCVYAAAETDPGLMTEIRYAAAKADGPVLAMAIGGPQAVKRQGVVYDLLPGMAAIFVPHGGKAFVEVSACLRGVGGILFVEPLLESHVSADADGPDAGMKEVRAATEEFFRQWVKAAPEVRKQLVEAYFAQPAPALASVVTRMLDEEEEARIGYGSAWAEAARVASP